MRRFPRALFALSLAIGAMVVWPPIASGVPSDEFMILDYEAARALGIDVSVPEGFALCDLEPDWPGYDTAEEAVIGAEIADSRPECAANPELVEYVVGAPQPTSNHSQDPYHHNGQQTNAQNRSGGKGDFRVQNAIGVPHSTDNLSRFVVGRILVKKDASPTSCQNQGDTVRWAEAGWSEVSWSSTDNQRPYSWGTEDCIWRFYGQQYTIQDGQLYGWRVVEINRNLNTYILWNDQWQLLRSYDGPDCTSDVCAVESYIEIYSNVDGAHPGWSGHADSQNLELKRSGTWSTWGSSVSTITGDVNPYVRCAVSNYDAFYVLDGGSC